jgi:phosphoglycolate phosphatase
MTNNSNSISSMLDLHHPQAILFDLDGTLLDSLPGIEFSIRSAFAQCALPEPQKNIRSLIGPPIRSILASLAGDVSPSTLDRLEQAFRTSYDSEGWSMTPHYPAATNVLRSLHSKGVRLFVASNKPIHIATRILQEEGTFALFEAVLTRDSRIPPYAGKLEIMQCLIEAHDLDPGRCLMVGDTMEDVEAAAHIPMRIAFMTHGYGHLPESANASVVMRLNHFSELLPNLAKEFAQ